MSDKYDWEDNDSDEYEEEEPDCGPMSNDIQETDYDGDGI
jgi:hypothetical protein